MSLERFVTAQEPTYASALAELQAGAKQGHWMWFIFPQIAGLGLSQTAQYYAIADLDEAKAYLTHNVLGPRLIKCTQAVLAWEGKRAIVQILGETDAMKFASSMTLFEVAGGIVPFGLALDAFYYGERDKLTLDLLESQRQSPEGDSA